MRRNSEIGLAILLLALGSCGQTGQTSGSEGSDNTEVQAVVLHPCKVTGTQLTDEDCQAAQYWLDKASQGTAAFNAPKRMFQGQTKLVTLAIGTAPPQSQASPTPSQSTSENSAEDNSNAVAPQPTPKPDPQTAPTPHDVVAGAAEPNSNIVDYHPFVGRQMAADLEGDGFDVKLLSPRVQPVSDESVTTWEWQVTARRYGQRTLVIKTAVVMIDSQGRPQPLVPTSDSKLVSVWIGPQGILDMLTEMPNWLKAITAILVALAGTLAAWRGLRGKSVRKASGDKPPSSAPQEPEKDGP